MVGHLDGSLYIYPSSPKKSPQRRIFPSLNSRVLPLGSNARGIQVCPPAICTGLAIALAQAGRVCRGAPKNVHDAHPCSRGIDAIWEFSSFPFAHTWLSARDMQREH